MIFNEGQSGRRGVVEGMLEESGSTIPVVGASFSTGEELHAAVDSAELRIVVDAQMTQIETENIFAETETPVSENVVLVGAHMDSVVAGPGINDNGSGLCDVVVDGKVVGGTSPITGVIDSLCLVECRRSGSDWVSRVC